jgi:hypothetical protein
VYRSTGEGRRSPREPHRPSGPNPVRLTALVVSLTVAAGFALGGVVVRVGGLEIVVLAAPAPLVAFGWVIGVARGDRRRAQRRRQRRATVHRNQRQTQSSRR